jgi:uncharacterized membrane protein YqjE
MSDDKPGASPGGLHDVLSRLAAAAIALVRTRAEIAALDFDEAGTRAKSRVALLVVALLCFAVGTLGATAFIVVYFWDTHRLTALGVITIAYFVAGVLAFWRFSVRQRTDPRPFAATIAELERDLQWLTRKTGNEE